MGVGAAGFLITLDLGRDFHLDTGMQLNSAPVAGAGIDTPHNPNGRFALYFAPEPATRLWSAGCAWLGRDAARNAPLPPPRVEGLSVERWRAITETAARYGFHATLKPPFHLASPSRVASLDAALAAFAAASPPIPLPPLRIAEIDGFLSIQLAGTDTAVHGLADACVRDFDTFRAPPSAAERARRQETKLSERQRTYLQAWGYPYVFEEWRFHMTLTCRLDGAELDCLTGVLRRTFAAALAEPAEVDALCLFHQDSDGAPFRILRRYRLGRSAFDEQ